MIDELTLLIDAAANHAIYFLDPGGTITLWSHSAERLSGWSAREAIGRSFDLLHTSADCLAGRPQRVLAAARASRSEEHTSELQSLMRISYAVFCLKKKKQR